MLTFYDRINKKETLKKTKRVLKEYARMLDILDEASYDIGIRTNFSTDETTSFSSLKNADQFMLSAIHHKDMMYRAVIEYVSSVQFSLSKLPPDEVQIINLEFIKKLSKQKIEERLCICSTSRKTITRLALLDFALAHDIIVMLP